MSKLKKTITLKQSIVRFTGAAPVATPKILREDSGYILREDGSKILRES